MTKAKAEGKRGASTALATVRPQLLKGRRDWFPFEDEPWRNLDDVGDFLVELAYRRQHRLPLVAP